MTPLQDAEYTKEVTQCLSQSIVWILQTRPQDPIAFLAQSLRAYRRDHPREPTTKETEQSLAAENPVKGHDESLKSFAQSDNKNGGTNASETAINSSPTSYVIKMDHTIATNSNVEQENVISSIHNRFSHIDFVHEEFCIKVSTLGDLFDDDDIR